LKIIAHHTKTVYSLNRGFVPRVSLQLIDCDLKNMSSLTSLSFVNQNIGAALIRAIADRCQALTSLTFDDMNTSKAGAFEHFSMRCGASLTRLSMRFYRQTADDIAMLLLRSTKLQWLDLSDTHWDGLYDELMPLLVECKDLQTLKLRHLIGARPTGAQIEELLTRCTRLVSLDISVDAHGAVLPVFDIDLVVSHETLNELCLEGYCLDFEVLNKMREAGVTCSVYRVVRGKMGAK
jgi:hypothetical protein